MECGTARGETLRCLLSALPLLMLGCGSAAAPTALCPAGTADDSSLPVVAPGTGAPLAVGYVTHDAGDVYGNPSCGAALVHPRVAVTAVHCLERALATPGARIGVGLGPICNRVVPVSAIVPFSDERDYDAPGREEWDLAALVLERPIDTVTPLAITAAEVGCGASSVGYGRKVPGGRDVREGYDGARRTLPMCIDQLAPGVQAHSVGEASPCFGDSGSPLLDASGALVGVLTAFVPALDDVRCTPGEGLVYVDVAAHRSFVDGVLADVDAGRYP